MGSRAPPPGAGGQAALRPDGPGASASAAAHEPVLPHALPRPPPKENDGEDEYKDAAVSSSPALPSVSAPAAAASLSLSPSPSSSAAMHSLAEDEDGSCVDVNLAAMGRAELQNAVLKAYSRLSRAELGLLLALRALPACGSTAELARRLAAHDVIQRAGVATPRMHTPPPSSDLAFPPVELPASSSSLSFVEEDAGGGDGELAVTTTSAAATPTEMTTLEDAPTPVLPAHQLPSLPPELWADIFEFVSDWELSTALGMMTALRPPADWSRTGTALDRALLSGSDSYVAAFLARHPSAHKFTKLGARALVRFGYVELLSYLHRTSPEHFRAVFSSPGLQLPELASRLGQTRVLDWWASIRDEEPALAGYDDKPLEEASRKGHTHVLAWWAASPLPLRYGLVMDVASAAGQTDVLEWWKNSGLRIEYRDALRIASWKGEVAVLEWWRRSGLRLIYDKECLVEATKFNRVEVLEWWLRSGLTIEYMAFDIEGALEDAIGGGQEAREWWARRKVRFDVGVKEWMEYKVLKP